MDGVELQKPGCRLACIGPRTEWNLCCISSSLELHVTAFVAHAFAPPTNDQVRRRAVTPGFHKKWLTNMIEVFADCGDNLCSDLAARAAAQTPVEMEERFCSVTLDIIGKAVFNYDFGSVTKENPIVKALYRVLCECEHRSTSFIL